MKATLLGKKIIELRQQTGITQKELSDLCRIDIRTIQRIESGDVRPRISTLKLLSESLGCELSSLNGLTSINQNPAYRKIILLPVMMGIVYLINWIFYMPILPVQGQIFQYISPLILAVIHMVSAIFFYYGFYLTGSFHQNKLLQFAAVIIMILVPLFVISDFVATTSSLNFIPQLKQLLVIVLGCNSVLFGAGLLKMQGELKNTGLPDCSNFY